MSSSLLVSVSCMFLVADFISPKCRLSVLKGIVLSQIVKSTLSATCKFMGFDDGLASLLSKGFHKKSSEQGALIMNV